MPSFADVLVVAISTRALFDLEEENKIYHEQGNDAYREYQRRNESVILNKGTAFHIIEALLDLNKLADVPLVEVIVMSKNSPETAVRVLNSIDHYNLGITRSAFTGSEPLVNYMEAFTVDLFLSRDEGDVQDTIDSRVAAAALIYDPPKDYVSEKASVRIAFDADAVLFSEDSEYIFKTQGMDAFHKNEKTNVSIPLKEGPYAKVLRMLSEIQKKIKLKQDISPLRIAIVTARNSPSHMRVINTLRKWDVQVDEAFFLGGISKDKVLKAFKAHIFFDDQENHLIGASVLVPSGKVPYRTDSILRTINVNDLKPATDIIILPEPGNNITSTDAENGILRITKNAAAFFPNVDGEVIIIFNKKSYKAKYHIKIGRSNNLHLGKSFFKQLMLRAGEQLQLTKTKPSTYLMEKVLKSNE